MSAPVRRPRLVEDLLPVYDVSDEVATVVRADAATTWASLLEVDLIELGRKAPIVAALGAVRILPEVVRNLARGERPERPETMRLRDLAVSGGGGWLSLGVRERDELALGLVGRFWRPVIEYASVDADDFSEFDEPGFAKTVYSLSVVELDGERCLLRGTMRTATTDERARRWFRRYWTLGVGSGAHILVNALIDSAREAAEADPDQ
jgi:hypothetical protein